MRRKGTGSVDAAMARGSAAEQQGRGRRIARLLSCACLLVAVGSVVALPPAIVDLDKRQLASSADAEWVEIISLRLFDILTFMQWKHGSLLGRPRSSGTPEHDYD